ncbi:MAG: hypothetical protein IKQ71_01965 [Lachnospiraceae bacterium]|nr:hypothetical protein [Lachnospiraceae bacterium]
MAEGIIVEGHAYVTERENNMKAKVKGMIMMFAFVAVFSITIPVFAVSYATDFNSSNGSNHMTGNARISKAAICYNVNYNVHVSGVNGIYGRFIIKGEDGVNAVDKTVYAGSLTNKNASVGCHGVWVKARINGASTYVSNYIYK